MLLLIIGLVLFLGIHSVSIVAEGWRDSTMQRVGEGAWKGIYSLVSLAGFGLIVWGYGEARLDHVLLYAPPAWLRHVGMLVLLPVFPLLVAVYFPGRIRRVAKHPMLLATKLWALAHLLMNGASGPVVVWRLPYLGGRGPNIDETPNTASPSELARVENQRRNCGCCWHRDLLCIC